MKKLLLAFVLLSSVVHLSAEQYYWIGGTGNWSDPAHWSLDDNGSGISAGVVPTITDDVYFNEFSFENSTDTLFVQALNIACQGMDWAGLDRRVILYFDDLTPNKQLFQVAGSMILNPLLSIQGDYKCLFDSTIPGNLIITAGVVLNDIEFNNELASWTLLDSLTVNGHLDFNAGTLNTFNNNVYCEEFSSNTSLTRKLLLGNNKLVVTGSINLLSDNLDFDAQTSELICSRFSGRDITLHDLTLDAIQPEIDGGNLSINNLKAGTTASSEFQGSTNGFVSVTPQFALPGGETITINGDLSISSICSDPVQLISSIPGTQAMLVKTSGTIVLQDVAIRDIHASGGADFTAIESYDDGNNSGWTIISPNAPCLLPVVLARFEANCMDWKVQLNWVTETEVNNDYFSIERCANGVDFEEIAKIPGAGTTDVAQEYSFIDTEVQTGMNYYRLRQIDFDGKSTYSDIAVASCENIWGELEVYPNPSRSAFYINFSLTENADMNIRVFDLQGKTITQKEFPSLASGYHNIPLNLDNVEKGIYIVEMYINDQFQQRKLMKL